MGNNLDDKASCSLCGNMCQTMVVDLPFFRHLDFKTVANRNKVTICLRCGVVENKKLFTESEPIFRTTQYASSCQTDQLIYVCGESQPVSRSRAQATKIASILGTKSPTVLDIGCFDGRLLNELSIIYPKARMIGYDVASDAFPKAQKTTQISYISDRDELFNNRYDLVIYSHSISYVPDLAEQLIKVYSVLSDEGILLVQMPDIVKNPYYALMGDQLYTLSPSALLRVLTVNGFDAVTLPDKNFPREQIMVARKSSNECTKTLVKPKYSEYRNALKKLETTKALIARRRYKESYGVFGTTANAAFVDSLIGEQVTYFVDENIRTPDLLFRGKPIYHPQELSATELVYFPYLGKVGGIVEKIKRQFSFGVIQV